MVILDCTADQAPALYSHLGSTASASLTHRTSLAEILASAPDQCQHQLDPPEALPLGGPGAVFTLLYTSGSSGRPKAVVHSAASFYADVSQTLFHTPLSTVSYIPLSHSSDR